MSKISEKIRQLKANETFVSLEFFPPKTESGLKNLLARIERLSVLNPLFVSITWGAGGSTSESSLELAEYCQRNFNLNVCLHLTCTNTTKQLLDQTLDRAKQAGIRNILALRGDPPRLGSVSEKSEFNYAEDLVRYIRKTTGDYFAIGVAAYPDGHVEGLYDANQDFENDIPYLVRKIEAGADFIITQLFFDVAQYLKFELRVLSFATLRNIPIIPGLIPINNYQLFQRVSKLSHASIPPSLLAKFPPSIQSNDRAVKEIGVDYLNDIVNELHAKSKNRVLGFHFYTLNLETSIAKLVAKSPLLSGELDSVESVHLNNLVITDSQAEVARLGKSKKYSKKEILTISSGIGTLGKEATWDEYPNGRFGDSRSPAYGEIDGYGPSIKIPAGVVNPTVDLWPAPQTVQDISQLFIDYLIKRIPALPFSDLSINSETLLIQEELIDINSKNWFTLSSQPAINGCNSDDSVFGWGPRNGYLYQKAYVELLIPISDWDGLKARIDSCNQEGEYQSPPDGKLNELSYYVGGASQEFFTNICPNARTTAVTWGVFPNKEIVQTTIIEEESFKAWNEEAFKILNEWAELYLFYNTVQDPKLKQAYKLLKQVKNSYYLVTLFHNDYQNEDALWDILR